jgi:hypothetical protein
MFNENNKNHYLVDILINKKLKPALEEERLTLIKGI